jgi:hypothetical protein
MKTTKSKNKIFTTALLGAAGAIALCAQQAFALGMMGGAVGAHAGGIGSGHFGSMASRTEASGMAGAVTMNGITVLPNGSLVVPAVTPRVPRSTDLDLRNLDQTQNTQGPCRTTHDCAAY